MNEDVIIIGGGPAGLLTSYYLKNFGVKSRILERKLAGESWREMREGMVMLSPASPAHDLTSLTYDAPIWSVLDLGGPFATKEEFITYLGEFIKNNRLTISENKEVSNIKKTSDGFELITSDDKKYKAKAVVVATGVIGSPYIPEITGVKDNPGVCHSSRCKDAETYRGKKVLIVGAGNSGAELAVEFAGIAEVTLASKGKLKFFSKTNDLSHIRGLSESLLKELIKFHIVEFIEKARIEKINDEKVSFNNGKEQKFDNIIFATGYGPHLPEFSGMSVKKSKKGFPLVSSSFESISTKNLYFTGPLAQNNKNCSFIHCFRPNIEPMALSIAEKLGH